jgi:hypothetical protein
VDRKAVEIIRISAGSSRDDAYLEKKFKKETTDIAC